jgi:hypothetical protein
MMKYRKKILIIAICIFFVFEWLFLNRNYLSEINNCGIEGLINISSSFSGYNFYISHGTGYALIYLMLLMQSFPDRKEQLLIRMNRGAFIRLLYKSVLRSSLVFSGIFISITAVFTVIFVDFQNLIASGYYIGIFITYVLLLLYYFFVGALFCCIELCQFSKGKSLIICFVLLVVLTFLPSWLDGIKPINNLIVFDYLFRDRLNYVNVLLNLLKEVMLIIFVYYTTYKCFCEKDVLNES